MDTIVAALAIVLLVISIIIRSIDTIKFHAFGVDTFGNLLYSRALEGGPFNLYKVGPDALDRYPHLLPRLLSCLRSKLSVRVLHLIPKLFDVLTSIAVFVFAAWISGNDFVALLALLFYTLSPINVINGFGIGTRSIGSFFLAVSLLASCAAITNAQLVYTMFPLALATCIMLMTTNRIAYKSYLLLASSIAFLLPFGIGFGMPLLILGLSFVLTMLLTRGHLLDDFKGQIFLIRFFGHRKTKRSIMKQVALVFYYDLSWCIAVLAVINGASLFLVMWLCMIIAISFSWPWGEGERHIALGTVAASILAATVVSNQIFVIIPLFLAETAVILRTSIRILRNRCLISVDERLLEVFDDIKSQSDNSLFLCLPPVYSFATAYFTQKKVLYGDGTSQDGVLFQAQVLDATNTEEGLNLLTSQYPVTHLFVDRNTFPMAINSDQWESLLRKERFEVLKRRIALEK